MTTTYIFPYGSFPSLFFPATYVIPFISFYMLEEGMCRYGKIFFRLSWTYVLAREDAIRQVCPYVYVHVALGLLACANLAVGQQRQPRWIFREPVASLDTESAPFCPDRRKGRGEGVGSALSLCSVRRRRRRKKKEREKEREEENVVAGALRLYG